MRSLSSGDLPRVIAALTEHLEFATAQFALFSDLRRAVERDDLAVFHAHDYFWFALHAHRDAAILHLARLFDSDRRAVSLARLISTSPVDAVPQEIRRADAVRVSHASSDVRRLLRLRHTVFAHRSIESARMGGDALIQQHDLSQEEVRLLLEDASTLLHRYGGPRLDRQVSKQSLDARTQLSAIMVYLREAEFYEERFSRSELEVDGALKQPRTRP